MPNASDFVIKIKSRFLLRACMAELENGDRVEDCLFILWRRAKIACVSCKDMPLPSVVVTHECYEESIQAWLDRNDAQSLELSSVSFSYHPTDESAIDWATRHVCEYHSAILITKEFDLPF